MKTAVFLDLDGTLWDAFQIPAPARTEIMKERENGHKVFANTDRPQPEVRAVDGLSLNGLCMRPAPTSLWVGAYR